MSPSLSIVIPVYNSEATLEPLAAALEKELRALKRPFELILVNDGSRDGSWEVMQRLARRRRWIRVINLMRNYGQHNALLCGIREARHEMVVTMDDDLQNPPEEIPRMLERLEQGFDVVYGTPEQQQHGLLRDLASEMTKLALKRMMGAETARNVSAFRIFRTKVRDAFPTYRSPFVSIDVLLTWGTSRFDYIRVRHDPRAAGVSNYTLKKLLVHALNMVTGFSTVPLQMASWVGFLFTLFGMLVLGYVVLRYWIEGGSVPGFPFLASIIALFSGAQLFALGIIGEYLARMHFRSMQVPAYVVREGPEDMSPVGSRGSRKAGSQPASRPRSRKAS